VLHVRGAPIDTVSTAGFAEAERAARDADAVLLVLGERGDMTGEATSRASIELPGSQLALAQAVVRSAGQGKPVVAVLMNGRPLAVQWLADSTSALVESWYLGVEHGNALADVLFGDYNPGGKEPVTWPRSVGQLPIHHYDPPNGRPNIPERGDYKAHWLDEPDAPLFAFGYGLSYSSFTLTALELPRSITRQDSLTIRARLTNTSKRDGDEVPQLYIRPRTASAVTGKRLVAYRRVHLKGGESRVVEFQLPTSKLAVLDSQDRWTVEHGTYEVTLGTSAQDGLSGTFELAN